VAIVPTTATSFSADALGPPIPECADFDIFAARHPALLDERLLSQHYRSATLAAEAARRNWVEPDLSPSGPRHGFR
jgi:hypothetical protein